MRPKERLWQLPADTHIIDWLDAKGFVYDVITEDDLEAEGVALLAVAPRALDLGGRASALTTVRAWPATRIPDRDRLHQLSLWMLRIKLTPLVTINQRTIIIPQEIKKIQIYHMTK